MATQNFDPMKALNTIRDSVNRIIEDGLSAANGAQLLPVDIYATDTSVVVKAGPLLGVKPEDIDVSIVGDKLTIKGETKPESGADAANYLRRERKFGAFSRTVLIPVPVKADQSSASFKEGMLTITIPKSEDAGPKVINVEPIEGL